ncbi:hypothetical protein QJQ45_000084 [Haematococcus lacustris]|nr:hypothetical protein QJQ45_000084 [Haematococcus lacustris]
MHADGCMQRMDAEVEQLAEGMAQLGVCSYNVQEAKQKEWRNASESSWRPLELCYWPEQKKLPAKGKEKPGLGYKRVRDKPPKAQQQQQQPAGP